MKAIESFIEAPTVEQYGTKTIDDVWTTRPETEREPKHLFRFGATRLFGQNCS